MDREEAPETLKHICEYEEARERFQKSNSTRVEYPDPTTAKLDEIVSKLCRGKALVDLEEWDTNHFFDVLYRSDFRLIKEEVKEKFYSELCKIFLKNDLVSDLSYNLNQLEIISHVKIYIVQGLLKVLQVMPTYEDNYLVLKYSPQNIWHNFGVNTKSHIMIRPCAFKIMCSNDEFNLAHINLLFHLLEVKHVILNGCNLNGRNTPDLFKGLSLVSIGLSECGSSVNDLIQNNMLGNLDILDELNLSRNILYDKTLKKLRHIPLKILDISYSIRITGRFVQSTWFATNFRTEARGELAHGNVDLLWQDGVLRDTIEIFRSNQNLTSHDTVRNLFIFSNILRELSLIGSLIELQFSKLCFPETLKVLIIKDYALKFSQFKVLCSLHLEKLDFEFEDKGIHPFRDLMNYPLRESIKELSVYFGNSSVQLIFLISAMKLRLFKCEGEVMLGDLDSLLVDYPEERKYLESLFISAQFVVLTSKFISGLGNLRNLRELTIELPHCCLRAYNCILSLTNLQESLESLKLSLKELGSEAIKKLLLFKRLRKLSFSFFADIPYTYLETVAAMENVKELEVEALVVGQLDLSSAQSLCAIPCVTLTIRSHYNCSISNEAFRFLSQETNLMNFSKRLVNLNMKGTIKKNMAIILGSVNWEKINLDECNIDDDTLRIFLKNERWFYTLDHLTFRNMKMIWEDIAQLALSKLEVRGNKISKSAIQFITEGRISKFLRYLFLEDQSQMCDFLLNANISEVDSFQSRFFNPPINYQ